MKRIIFITLMLCFCFLLCACSSTDNDNKNSTAENTDAESLYTEDNADNFTFAGDKGYRIGYDDQLVEFTGGDKDVFTSKNGSVLEIYLSGGKTVDDCCGEYVAFLNNSGYTVTQPASVAVGREYYSAKFISAENNTDKKNCYFIPVENECLVLIFDVKTGDEELFQLMFETFTID